MAFYKGGSWGRKMSQLIYEARMAGRVYRLATDIDLGPEAMMGFLRSVDGWEARALARHKPEHSTVLTFVPATRIDK